MYQNQVNLLNQQKMTLSPNVTPSVWSWFWLFEFDLSIFTVVMAWYMFSFRMKTKLILPPKPTQVGCQNTWSHSWKIGWVVEREVDWEKMRAAFNGFSSRFNCFFLPISVLRLIWQASGSSRISYWRLIYLARVTKIKTWEVLDYVVSKSREACGNFTKRILAN